MSSLSFHYAAEVQSEESLSRAASYIVVSAAATHTWDLIIGLSSDIDLIKKGLSLSTCLYLLSRYILVVLLITSAGLTIDFKVAYCEQLVLAQDALNSATVGVDTFIVLLRIRAIYFQKRTPTVLLLALWLGVLGSCINTTLSIRGFQSPISLLVRPSPTDETYSLSQPAFCGVAQLSVGCLSCFISAALFDTIVFVSVTWRILSYYATDENWSAWFKYILGKRRLSFLPETVLRGAQEYYVVAICMLTIIMSFMHAPGIPPVISYTLVLPCTVVCNAASFRVFRDLKLSDARQRDTSTTRCVSEFFARMELDDEDTLREDS